jgi:hypothetical protein
VKARGVWRGLLAAFSMWILESVEMVLFVVERCEPERDVSSGELPVTWAKTL